MTLQKPDVEYCGRSERAPTGLRHSRVGHGIQEKFGGKCFATPEGTGEAIGDNRSTLFGKRLRTIALPLVKIDVDLDRKMGIFCCCGKIGGLVGRGVSCRLRSSRSLKREECLALGNGSAASRAVWYRPVVKQVSDHTF